jgi:capsular exopolysaccharide synthesis family protein
MERDEKMSVFGPDGKDMSSDPTGQPERESSSDPIARNPKDVNGPGSKAYSFSDYFDGTPPDSERDKRVPAAEIQPRSGATSPVVAKPVLPARSEQWNRPGQTQASAFDVLAGMLRYKWTILLVFVLVSAPAIGLIWTQTVLMYGARAELQVSPVIQGYFDKDRPVPFYPQFVNTQVSIVRSPMVLNRVVESDKIRETQWYAAPSKSLIQKLLGGEVPHLERLRKSLSVRPRARTEIIDISFTARSDADARLIVNTVLDEYIVFAGKERDRTREVRDEKQEADYALLQTEIKTKEKSRAGLLKELRTGNPDKLIGTQQVRLEEMKTRLAELDITIGLLKREIDQMGQVDSNDTEAIIAAEQPAYYEDTHWQQLDLRLKTYQHEISGGVHGPTHPETIRLTRDMEFAEELLREREEQLDEQWRKRSTGLPMVADGQISSPAVKRTLLEEQLERLEYEKNRRDKQRKELKEEFDKRVKNAQWLEEQNIELLDMRAKAGKMLQSIEQRNRERKVPHTIAVLTRAYSRSEPDKDRRVVYTAMALFVALGMGGGVAFLRGMRNQTIYAATDMPRAMLVPFLGYVPLVHRKKAPGSSPCDEIERNQVRLVEAIRVLRTALLSRLDRQGCATVLVTSANEGTGKSSFTMMLGKSLAQAGRKVLMVDADLHKMTLSRRFGLLDRAGFAESLRNKSATAPVVCTTEVPNLDVLPAGHRGEKNAVPEEMANGAFRTCIDTLLARYGYDIVLLDASPVLPVADAVILAGQVDGTIMVERQSVSQRSHVLSALDRLNSTGGQLLGTVFVGSNNPAHYGYGYSYGYHRNETKES